MSNSPKPKEVSPGVWLLRLAVPEYGDSNAYLIEDKLLTLIDSGHSLVVSSGVLEEQLNSLGHTAADIDQIIYTHHHIDHTGGGMVLAEKYKMLHLISGTVSDVPRDKDTMLLFMPKEIPRYYPKLENFVKPWKTEENLAFAQPQFEKFNGMIEALSDGDIINLGKRQLSVHSTPGHCLHDLMLLDTDNGVLFSGDSLLKWDTTFFFPEGGEIDIYLQSMAKLSQLEQQVKLILPGHGGPINSDLREFIADSQAAIAERCEQIVSFVKVNGPIGADEIFVNFHGNLQAHIGWSSIFGTLLTYLRYLVKCGQISEDADEPGVYF